MKSFSNPKNVLFLRGLSKMKVLDTFRFESYNLQKRFDGYFCRQVYTAPIMFFKSDIIGCVHLNENDQKRAVKRLRRKRKKITIKIKTW